MLIGSNHMLVFTTVNVVLVRAEYGEVININSCCNSMNFSRTSSVSFLLFFLPFAMTTIVQFNEFVWTSVFILYRIPAPAQRKTIALSPEL